MFGRIPPLLHIHDVNVMDHPELHLHEPNLHQYYKNELQKVVTHENGVE